jgi:hypothetical protein
MLAPCSGRATGSTDFNECATGIAQPTVRPGLPLSQQAARTPRAQHAERVVAASRGHQLLGELGIDDRPPLAIRSTVSMNSSTSMTRLLSRLPIPLPRQQLQWWLRGTSTVRD